MKTLYLHIGTMKTGTTNLQSFFNKNRDILKKYGVIFRHMPYVYSDATMNRNAHFLCKRLYDENMQYDKESTDRRWYEGMDIVKGWFEECDSVLLSDEVMWNVNYQLKGSIIKRIADYARDNGFVVKVIVYLRRQDELADSMYRQSIRRGYSAYSWDEFLNQFPKKTCLDYEYGLSLIEEVIDSENIIVRRYDGLSYEDNDSAIYSDFLSAIGVPFTDEYIIPKMDHNPSLQPQFAAIKKTMNKLIDNSDVPTADSGNILFRDTINECCRQGYFGGSKYMSDDESAAYMETFRESNHRVAEKYLGADTLFENEPELKAKWQWNAEEQIEALALFMGTIIKNQQLQIKNQQLQLEEIQKKQSELKDEMGSLKNSKIYRLFNKMGRLGK